MTAALLSLPLLIPLAAAAACAAMWARPRAQAGVCLGAALATLAASVALTAQVLRLGPIAAQAGAWPAPFGITLVADTLSCVMLLINSGVLAAAALHGLGSVDRPRASGGHHALTLTLAAGVSGAFLTGDIFNMYVWYEVMLLSSFVLVTLGSTRRQLEGGLAYLTLNLIASGLFLAGVGVLYGLTGTVNMADLALKLPAADRPQLVTAVGAVILTAFAIKAAAAPLYFWLPASYDTCPPVVAALMAGVLSKVGVYSIIRASSLFLGQEAAVFQWLLALSGLTMVLGVFGAAVAVEIRRVLAFHSVSQIGYMLMGFAVAMLAARTRPESQPVAELALAGAILFMVHHAAVKTNLFLISGVVLRARGTTRLAQLGGLCHTHPLTAGLFFVTAMSLAGVPLLSGFIAKLALVRAGVQAGQDAIVAVSLFVSLLTLYSMSKVWDQAFWKAPAAPPTKRMHFSGDPATADRDTALMLVPIGLLAGLALLIGLWPSPALDLCRRAAQEVLRPALYVGTVLGQDPTTEPAQAPTPPEEPL